MIDIRAAQLKDYTPESLKDEPEISAMNAALDPELNSVADIVINAIIIPRISDLDEDTLDALAWEYDLLRFEGWGSATINEKRSLIGDVFKLYALAGTVWSMKRILEIYNTGTVSEWFDYGGDAFHYRLFYEVPEAGMTLEALEGLLDMVDNYSPVRAFLDYLQLNTDSEGELTFGAGVHSGITVSVGDVP